MAGKGESKSSARRTEAKEKAARVINMRKAGIPWEVIAQRVGFKDKSGAYRCYERAIKELVQEPAEDLRQLELSRLDDLHVALWKAATEGNHGAIDKILRIMERRARLTGLDAPVRSELSGPNGGPIQTAGDEYDWDQLSVEEAIQLKALLDKARRKKAPDGGN